MNNATLIAEARRNAPHSEDESLIMRLAIALEASDAKLAQLADAILGRTPLGWERVVRVNAKTITVTTPYSWTERVAIDKVLEVLT